MAERKEEAGETPKEKVMEEAAEEEMKKGTESETPAEEKPKETDEATKKMVEGEAKPAEAPSNKKDFRRGRREEKTKEEILEEWIPKTKLGKEVKAGKIKNIDDILNSKKKILEPEIVDVLIDVKSDLIAMGQSKGKFGGGKRRAWRQTQRKTKEGNVPTFSAFAAVGNEDGYVGVGVGKSMETLPARDKAVRKAKLNLIKVVRGDGSFDSVGGGNTSIPFKVEGKSGSVRITLMPAAPGTGLVVADELKKILKLAGIKDVYSKTSGRLRTTFNLIKACIDALEKTNPVKEETK